MFVSSSIGPWTLQPVHPVPRTDDEYVSAPSVSDREFPAPAQADPGLFGPDSVTWRVHADPTMALGGIRALFLQSTHPLVMAGFAEHSDYRTNPWARLRRTAEFVGRTTFGTTDDARELGARIRAVHARLSTVEPNTGRTIQLSDPELLRWVHVCEAQSFLTTYQRSGGTLAAGDDDRYYAEMQQAAALVGCSDVPRTAAEVDSYFQAMQPQLRVTAEAREASRFLVNAPMPRWVALATPAKLGWWSLGGLAFALMPRWARRMYSLPGLRTTDVAASLAARGLRSAVLALPADVREGPALREARTRLGLAA
jgi:uncharacterized protein (DUF2236 family)